MSTAEIHSLHTDVHLAAERAVDILAEVAPKFRTQKCQQEAIAITSSLRHLRSLTLARRQQLPIDGADWEIVSARSVLRQASKLHSRVESLEDAATSNKQREALTQTMAQLTYIMKQQRRANELIKEMDSNAQAMQEDPAQSVTETNKPLNYPQSVIQERITQHRQELDALMQEHTCIEHQLHGRNTALYLRALTAQQCQMRYQRCALIRKHS